MGQTIVEKIAQAHLAEGPKRPLRTGDFVSIHPRYVMTHDNTSAVMSKFKGIGAKKIHDPRQLVFALDHDIQNQDESNQKKYRAIEAFAKEHGVDFYSAGSGIGHQIMVERGYVVPGPLVGWFPVDEVTIAYLRGVHQRLKATRVERFTEEDIESWAKNPPKPDRDAVYAGRIVLDLNEITPHVSGPDTVQVMQSLAEMEKKKVAIQKAYLLSCVNSRVEDLEAAARVLRGKKVAPGVKFYLGAASKWVQEEAERRGIWRTLLDAGANPLPAGCGPCIGLGVGLLEPGEVGISATNRNFKGRMGSRDAQCYLASPEGVAASAAAGYICGPHGMADRAPERSYTQFAAAASAEKVEVLPGFPERVRGRLVFMPQDNVNTDAIYGKDYTYRDDMTRERMAKEVMENYDPQFAARTRTGDVIVSGFNVGTGSSREQAVTALKAKGIPLVIAASFAQT